ncbi:MAG: PAS domain S-box protein [Deltaproteobacteria bacterium]|nr:PAS domain S-box protein [Candidatus Anaeroferrophillus wilburensis]MBN2887844.1 PAS domain S-box protein [Deltaproteobacteria bacterium]
MSIKSKIFILLALLGVLFVAVNVAIQYQCILPGFKTLEQRESEKNLNRAVKAVERDLEHLSLLCYDWSEWDDTYDFVADGNQEYIDSNLVLTTFTHNRLALLYIIDRSGKVIWGKIYDKEIEEFITLPDFPEDQWPADHPLLGHRQPESVLNGYLMTSGGALTLSSRPILPSMGDGPIRGTLIMGRFLCDNCIQMMREQTQVDLNVWSFNCDTLPPNVCLIKDQLTPRQPVLFQENDKVTFGYTFFPDIFGSPAMILQVATQRDIFNKGLQVLKANALGTSIAALATILFLAFLLHSIISKPLTALETTLQYISRSGTLQQVDEKLLTHDEIGMLGMEFNRMIIRLQNDLERRKQAEQALAAKETHLNTLLSTAPDGIVTVNHKGIIESANRAMELISGYGTTELLGRHLLFLIPARYQDAVKQEVNVFIAGSETSLGRQGMEITAMRKDGSELPIHVLACTMDIDQKHKYACFIRDISELKELHDNLLRTRHLAAIGEMGASIAHEIRNPLAGISGAVQVLVENAPADSPDLHVLNEILQMASRMESSVDQMLEFAKDWNPEITRCDLVELIDTIIREARINKDLKNATIYFKGPEASPSWVDPVLFSQVLVNLLHNAAESFDGPGEINCLLERHDRETIITLQDNGAGMTPEVLAKVFKPFFTTKIKGTGLGLSICQKIIEKHGGSITLSSTVGVGTKAVITLPGKKLQIS